MIELYKSIALATLKHSFSMEKHSYCHAKGMKEGQKALKRASREFCFASADGTFQKSKV